MTIPSSTDELTPAWFSEVLGEPVSGGLLEERLGIQRGITGTRPTA